MVVCVCGVGYGTQSCQILNLESNLTVCVFVRVGYGCVLGVCVQACVWWEYGCVWGYGCVSLCVWGMGVYWGCVWRYGCGCVCGGSMGVCGGIGVCVSGCARVCVD